MEEGFWGEEVGGGDGGVVDFGDVEVVEDYGRVFVSLGWKSGRKNGLVGKRILLEYAFWKLAWLALKVVLMVGRMLV